jgi:endo-1,4-beta-xylanase
MNRNSEFLCLAVIVLAATWAVDAQPAKGANKFLGNTTSQAQVRSDFGNYWNQITPENEATWAVVERTRDSMSWEAVDRVANYAESAGILWKFHTLIWGGSRPVWFSGLSQTDQLAEIEEWFDVTKEKYPDLPLIDVMNEAHPNHMPAPYRDVLGGHGSTGYDWIFKAFHMARERWPNAILIYNDYNNIEFEGEVNWTVRMIQAAIAAKVPIDAIGCEAHGAHKLHTDTVKAHIDKLAATGLPIFISEYDISHADDSLQLKIIRDQFPMFWNHPSIVGVTLWGYVVGQTWIPGTGLITDNGVERPALTWLKQYVKDNPNPHNQYPQFLSKVTVSIASESRSRVYKTTRSNASRQVQLRIFDLSGRIISTPLVLNEKRNQGKALRLMIP